MSLVSIIQKKRLLDELGQKVINATIETFETVKSTAKTALEEIRDDVKNLQETGRSLSFEIMSVKFNLVRLDTVALIENDENIFSEDILTNATHKTKYTGRIIFYCKTDENTPYLTLGELFVNEVGNYYYISSIGWKREKYILTPKYMLEKDAKNFISKGINDAFFSIQTVWRRKNHFMHEEEMLDQGNKIGFI